MGTRVSMVEHWLDRKIRLHLPINPEGFVNPPRMDAHTIRKLVAWRNKMNMVKRSLHEDHLIYEERNEPIL